MTQQSISGGQALIQALIDNGSDLAFGVPGESYLAALDAMFDASDRFKFVTARHEAGAANMAEAYGKLTGKPGICFVTRGPGATHAAIGLHTAFQDSTPMILFIGQVASDQVEREAFQEIDYRRFLSEVTKWTAEINDASRIAEYVGRAYRVATSGRPGPVALALPEDMLASLTVPQTCMPYSPSKPHPGDSDIAALSEIMENAERPLMMLGGSGWDAASVEVFERFSRDNNLPVCVSFRCQDRFNNTHPNYAGDMGIGANPALIKRMQSADVLLVVGPRLGEMTTGGYERLNVPVPDQTLIHVHQGAEELGRVYQPDLAINATPSTMARKINGLRFKYAKNWSEGTKTANTAFQSWSSVIDNPGPVQLSALYNHMNSTLPADTIICNGAGNYAAWLHRFHRYQTFPSQLAPTSGAMGYGVPAAIGAKIAFPHRTVIAAAGDGCFMMSVNELATAAQHKAHVIFLVFNNSMLGTIRMHQEKHYPKRIAGTALQNPDFVTLANSFGLHSERVGCTEDFAAALERAINITNKSSSDGGKPALIEITVDPEAISPTTTLSSLQNS